MEMVARSGASKMLVVAESGKNLNEVVCFQIDISSEVQDKAFLQYMKKNIVYAVRSPPLSCTLSECLTANATVISILLLRFMNSDFREWELTLGIFLISSTFTDWRFRS